MSKIESHEIRNRIINGDGEGFNIGDEKYIPRPTKEPNQLEKSNQIELGQFNFKSGRFGLVLTRQTEGFVPYCFLALLLSLSQQGDTLQKATVARDASQQQKNRFSLNFFTLFLL